MAAKLKKPMIRELQIVDSQGKILMAKMTVEGIYFKAFHDRWTSGVMIPWQTAFHVASSLKAREEAIRKATGG